MIAKKKTSKVKMVFILNNFLLMFVLIFSFILHAEKEGKFILFVGIFLSSPELFCGEKYFNIAGNLPYQTSQQQLIHFFRCVGFFVAIVAVGCWDADVRKERIGRAFLLSEFFFLGGFLFVCEFLLMVLLRKRKYL